MSNLFIEMAGLRKSRRTRRTKRKSRGTSRRQRQRAGGAATIYFLLSSNGTVSNVFSSDSGFTVEAVNPPSKAGKINIKGGSTSKITGVDVKAIPTASTTGWASGLMSPVISNTNKFTLSKGATSLMGRTAIAIPAAGVALTDNLNINNLLGTANWSASKQPHPTGVVPPNAAPGTKEANIMLTITTA